MSDSCSAISWWEILPSYQLELVASTIAEKSSAPVEKLPDLGQEIQLFIHSVYREDAQTLYGFSTSEERDFFRLVIEKVSGIGPGSLSTC